MRRGSCCEKVISSRAGTRLLLISGVAATGRGLHYGVCFGCPFPVVSARAGGRVKVMPWWVLSTFVLHWALMKLPTVNRGKRACVEPGGLQRALSWVPSGPNGVPSSALLQAWFSSSPGGDGRGQSPPCLDAAGRSGSQGNPGAETWSRESWGGWEQDLGKGSESHPRKSLLALAAGSSPRRESSKQPGGGHLGPSKHRATGPGVSPANPPASAENQG